jgi:hemoglobin
MIVEYIRYAIPEGRATEFKNAYRDASRSLDASEECLSYELSRCTEEPGSWILRIEWAGMDEHLKGFRGSPEFGPFLAAIRPYIDDIQEMRHYEPTEIRSG